MGWVAELLDHLAEKARDVGLTMDHGFWEDDGDGVHRTDRLAKAAIPAFVRIGDDWQLLAIPLLMVDEVAGTDPVTEIAFDAETGVDADGIVNRAGAIRHG